ncbi:MAG: SDR family oxidoreductase [Ruminococcaceae bacterium]|nr:SDR family oxidoreductase [Oscillospiraceae bacterium]
MFDLTGRTALVTGATQGIGFEIARLLAAHGAKVFVNGASSEEKCKRAVAKIPGAVPVRADLTQMAELERLYAVTGDVDILVLNASVQYKRAWDEFSEADFDEQVDCNLKSSYFLIKKYADGMKKRGWGRIVTIGSVNQYNQHPELTLYGITKAAQLKLVQNIAPALAPFGITMNNVAPGAIETPRNEAVLSDPANRSAVEGKIPCGYVGTPEDVAPAVLLLCSEEGRYITGADLRVDGGMSLKS